jgi:hypothetical protein
VQKARTDPSAFLEGKAKEFVEKGAEVYAKA